MPVKPLELNLSQRWAIIGATGAGKTTFARKLIARYLIFWCQICQKNQGIIISKGTLIFIAWFYARLRA